MPRGVDVRVTRAEFRVPPLRRAFVRAGPRPESLEASRDVDGRGSDGDGREFPGCVAPEGVVRERERELRPGWETWGVTRYHFTFFES